VRGCVGRVEVCSLSRVQCCLPKVESVVEQARRATDVPPVTSITLPARDGMSVEGLKEMPDAKSGNPKGILG
jgi:hypothetical protein